MGERWSRAGVCEGNAAVAARAALESPPGDALQTAKKTYHAQRRMTRVNDGQRAASGGPAAAAVPTFQVRFESDDDFLVEYTDQLRHGFLDLPLPQSIGSGTAVRLRVHLPDGAVLYLTGTVAPERFPVEARGTRIRVDPLTEAQRSALEACVQAVIGRVGAEEPDGDDPAGAEGDSTMSVLLVDDSVSHRIELGDALRSRGLRVRVAENGLLALSAALKRVPDVILTDVEMPQMDGWTLLRSVRQRKRLLHVPVVFLTRLSDELTRLRGYRMGVDDYLPKTMPPDEIVARLEGVLARRRQLPAASDAQGLRGDLEHVRLGSILAFLEAERRSGTLHLRNGSDQATVFLVQGGLARVDNLGRFAHPHDRMFDLLGWRVGQFEFRAAEGEVNAPAETTPLSYLLMEHARREDEAG